jgi:hypothetical protein
VFENTDLQSWIGPVVRLAPTEYSIADLDIYKQIYGPRTAYEKVKKTNIRTRFSLWLHDADGMLV